MVTFKVLYPARRGLNVVLNPMELAVLKALWDNHNSFARIYQHIVTNGHEWAYSTISTILKRLVKKGFIRVEKLNRGNIYKPALSEEEFLSEVVRQTLVALSSLDGGVTLEDRYRRILEALGKGELE